MHPDLVTYVNQTAAILLGLLPLQSLSSATALVYAYISDVGGWNPDNPEDPQGPGLPANGFSEQQAAEAITADQLDTVYDLSFTVTVTLNVQQSSQLTAGLSLTAAASALAAQVENFIEATVDNSPIPLSVASVGAQTTVNDFCLLGGNTTQAIRQIIASNVANQNTVKVVDYKTDALIYVIDTFGVDDTWNVVSVFTIPNNPISVTIQKYTTNTYATLDNSSSTVYVINVSPTTYAIVSGVTID